MGFCVVLSLWRLVVGMGVGGEYPVTAIFTSERYAIPHKGMRIFTNPQSVMTAPHDPKVAILFQISRAAMYLLLLKKMRKNQKKGKKREKKQSAYWTKDVVVLSEIRLNMWNRILTWRGRAPIHQSGVVCNDMFLVFTKQRYYAFPSCWSGGTTRKIKATGSR